MISLIEAQGEGKLKKPNGDLYEGNFKDSQFCGQGKYTWANGEIYEGSFIA